MARTQIRPTKEVKDDAEVERKYTFAEIRRILFPDGPPKRQTLEDLNSAIEEYMRETHGRR